MPVSYNIRIRPSMPCHASHLNVSASHISKSFGKIFVQKMSSHLKRSNILFVDVITVCFILCIFSCSFSHVISKRIGLAPVEDPIREIPSTVSVRHFVNLSVFTYLSKVFEP